VLRTEDFRGFGEHRRATQLGEPVRAAAQRRIGRDAGERIRAAAVEPEHDARRGDGKARFGGGDFDQARDFAARGLDGGARTAARLNGHAHQAPAAPSSIAQVMIDLVALAAQPQNHGGGNVGMIEHAAERAPKLIDIGIARMRATFAVWKRHHAIHIRRQRFAGVARGNQLGGMGGAVGCRHYRDVVARAGAAVFAQVAEEAGAILAARRRIERAGRELVRRAAFVESQVMRVYVAAGFDRRCGEADRLAITKHGRAHCNRPQRHFVAGRDGVTDRQRFTAHAQLGTRRQRHARHRDVIGWVKLNRRVFGARQTGDIEQHWAIPSGRVP
jgi:hypothetical protein